MISILICSRTQEISPTLHRNIEATIGCAYELIVIDNSENAYSIFEAYNLGIERSMGEYVCFMHDDILLLTDDWGTTIDHIFENDPKTGLIGVAGSQVKTKMPSAWWDCYEEHKVMNIVQHFPDKVKEHWYKGFTNNLLEEVAVIDGVFMAWRKDDSIKFNEKLKGFHNYDLNLAIACRKLNYKIVVTNQILIEHFSEGFVDKKWIYTTLNFDKHYGKFLPIQIIENRVALKELEFENGRFFCNSLLENEYSKKAFFYWIKLIALKPNSKFHKPFYRLFKKRFLYKLKHIIN